MVISREEAHLTVIAIPVLLSLLAAIGCTSVAVDVSFELPAEISLPNIRTLGVVEFALAPGDQVDSPTCGQDLTEELSQAIQDKRHFGFVERADLEAAIREEQLSLSDLFENSAEAQKLGRKVRADGLILGRIKVYHYGEQLFEPRPTWFDRYLRPLAFWLDAADREPRTYIHTRTGEAKVHVSLKVLDVTSGCDLAIKNPYCELTEEQTARNADPPPNDQIDLFRRCRLAIVEEYADAISPYRKKEDVRFRTGGAYCFRRLLRGIGLVDPNELEQGIDFVRHGNWSHALEVFEAAATQAAADDDRIGRGKALWNVALTHTCRNDFQKARDVLHEAWSLMPDESQAYSKTLRWIRRREAEMRKLDLQLNTHD